MIDPLVEAYESDELNGRPCKIRSLPIGLDEFDLRYWGTGRLDSILPEWT